MTPDVAVYSMSHAEMLLRGVRSHFENQTFDKVSSAIEAYNRYHAKCNVEIPDKVQQELKEIEEQAAIGLFHQSVEEIKDQAEQRGERSLVEYLEAETRRCAAQAGIEISEDLEGNFAEWKRLASEKDVPLGIEQAKNHCRSHDFLQALSDLEAVSRSAELAGISLSEEQKGEVARIRERASEGSIDERLVREWHSLSAGRKSCRPNFIAEIQQAKRDGGLECFGPEQIGSIRKILGERLARRDGSRPLP